MPTPTQTYSSNPIAITSQVVIPLSAGVRIEAANAVIYDAERLIRLNPLVQECEQLPLETENENLSDWRKQGRYRIVDKLLILGGMISTNTEYYATFTIQEADTNNKTAGIVFYVQGPMGVSTTSRWTVTERESDQAIVITEACLLRVPFLLRSFVVGNIKSSHMSLLDRIAKQLCGSSI
ncbi:hypothetical protein V1525DRAFT_421487 [Lipomyces kononenkoae]|uniref:Uncharacterized protein n=1 Tax=Lipomyces kononenkoae TaxID=34357 RepID=A0ACC3SVZ1_LIPKO